MSEEEVEKENINYLWRNFSPQRSREMEAIDEEDFGLMR